MSGWGPIRSERDRARSIGGALLVLLLALSAPALAGDDHRHGKRPSTRTYLERNHIIGGRAVAPGSHGSWRDYGRRYDSRSRRGGETTVIIIERPRDEGRRRR